MFFKNYSSRFVTFRRIRRQLDFYSKWQFEDLFGQTALGLKIWVPILFAIFLHCNILGYQNYRNADSLLSPNFSPKFSTFYEKFFIDFKGSPSIFLMFRNGNVEKSQRVTAKFFFGIVRSRRANSAQLLGFRYLKRILDILKSSCYFWADLCRSRLVTL